MANEPPVKKPAIMALYGSSFLRMPLTAQSNVEKRPPQPPKLPPNTGARILTAVIAPIRLSPYGEFLKPLIPCHIVPPIAYKYAEYCQLCEIIKTCNRPSWVHVRPCRKHRQSR